jgi:hypothetical protein
MQQQQGLPGRGGAHPAIADDGDGLAHRIRELAQQARDGGLRERELLGGARHAAQAHAGLEGDELREETVAEVTSHRVRAHGGSFAERKGLANGGRPEGRSAGRAGA